MGILDGLTLPIPTRPAGAPRLAPPAARQMPITTGGPNVGRLLGMANTPHTDLDSMLGVPAPVAPNIPNIPNIPAPAPSGGPLPSSIIPAIAQAVAGAPSAAGGSPAAPPTGPAMDAGSPALPPGLGARMPAMPTAPLPTTDMSAPENRRPMPTQ